MCGVPRVGSFTRRSFDFPEAFYAVHAFGVPALDVVGNTFLACPGEEKSRVRWSAEGTQEDTTASLSAASRA
jgi:hypothetical protein